MDNIKTPREFYRGAPAGAIRPPTAMSSLRSLRSLLSAQAGNRAKAILLGGAILHPLQTRRWLRFVGTDPLFWSLAISMPHWTLKIYRPYLSRRLTCSDRVSVMMQHYELMCHSGFGHCLQELAASPKTLCQFFGKSGVAFRLQLAGVNMSGREGELYLQLVSGVLTLYRAVFSFFMQNGEWYVKIGCVQGLRADDGADSIRSTTRELYGCRPKNLVVSVVRDIGDYFGCKGMIGIGNRNRILAHGARHSKTLPDYDQTWEELGAEKNSDSNFELPCTDILKTSFDDIPSKKRSEAKKKNALLASILESVRDSLDDERFGLERRA